MVTHFYEGLAREPGMPNTAFVNQHVQPNLDQLTGRSGKSVSEVIQSTARAAGEFVLGRYHDQGRIDIKGRPKHRLLHNLSSQS